MKPLKLAITFMLCIFLYAVKAQTITAPEPEFAYQISQVDSNNTTTALESQIAAGSRWSSKVTFKMKGAKSTVRLKQNETMNFIVNMGSNNKDITGVVQFFKLEQKGDTRSCTFNWDNPAGSPNAVAYVFKKYGAASYLVTVKSNLAPGEYAINIGLEDAKAISLFGID